MLAQVKGDRPFLTHAHPSPLRTAGVSTRDYNKARLDSQLNQSRKRTFRLEQEKLREVELKHALVPKDFQYYYSHDNSWNEYNKLSKKLKRFSHENTDPARTFKKTITNIPMIEE